MGIEAQPHLTGGQDPGLAVLKKHLDDCRNLIWGQGGHQTGGRFPRKARSIAAFNQQRHGYPQASGVLTQLSTRRASSLSQVSDAEENQIRGDPIQSIRCPLQVNSGDVIPPCSQKLRKGLGSDGCFSDDEDMGRHGVFYRCVRHRVGRRSGDAVQRFESAPRVLGQDRRYGWSEGGSRGSSTHYSCWSIIAQEEIRPVRRVRRGARITQRPRPSVSARGLTSRARWTTIPNSPFSHGGGRSHLTRGDIAGRGLER